MVHGKASFNKVYPREVSKKLERKKIILTIYASRMANSFDDKINIIDPETIEPLIIYGIKVVTKKSRDIKSKGKVI